MNDIALSMQNITKRFGNLVANDDISIVLGKGEILALLGENGAGKSTLMSILFGHYRADAGCIKVFGKALPAGDTQAALNAGVGMVHQHFALAENLTVLENILIGFDSLWKPRLSSALIRSKLLETAQSFGLEIDPDALVSSLSMGGRQRVEILKSLTRGAKILILDEPTAILTPQESESLFTTLKEFVAKGLSIVFISHKLGEVLRVSDRIAVLRGGKLIAERVSRGANEKILAELMVGKEVALTAICDADSESAALAQHPAKQFKQSASLSIVGLSCDAGFGKTLNDVHLVIHPGEIFGIAGVSGNGQTLLADVLSGVLKPKSGSVSLNGKPYPLGANVVAELIGLGVARVPEDRTQRGVVGDASLTENVAVGRHRSALMKSVMGFLNHKERETQAITVTERFDVRHAGLNKPARSLSGGNIQKLVLGRELGLMQNIELVIANQPTWGLDVGAIAYVHAQLKASCEQGAAVLLISDELDEVLALSDTVAVMFKGKLSDAKPRQKWSRASVGLAMAGAGFVSERPAHAA